MASEYSWPKETIFYKVYPDEYIYLTRKLKQRKIQEYKMQLQIIQNPHTKNPKELWNFLSQEEDVKREEKLDRSTFSRLKNAIARGSRIKVN